MEYGPQGLIHRRKSVDSDDDEIYQGAFTNAAAWTWTLDGKPLASDELQPLFASSFDPLATYSFHFAEQVLEQPLKRLATPVAYTHPSERNKKRKTAHRHVRSPALLFRPPEPAQPVASTSSARLFASSTAKIGKQTRMAPGESSWTGNSDAWIDAEAGMSRLSLMDEDAPKLPPIVVPIAGRSRSSSAPPAMLSTGASSLTADASPEVLKAQLLAILRTRAPDGGNKAGDAALKLRRWVAWNSWRKSGTSSVPTSPTSPTTATLLGQSHAHQEDRSGVYAAGKRAPSVLSAAMARTPSTPSPAEEASKRLVVKLRIRSDDDASIKTDAAVKRPTLQRAKSAPEPLLPVRSRRTRQSSGNREQCASTPAQGSRSVICAA